MITALMLWVRTNPRNVWLIAGLLAVAIAAGVLYAKGRSDEHKKTEAARRVAEAEAIKLDTHAKGLAGADLEKHIAQIAEHKEELTNAVAQVPDTVPDAVAVRLGCERLRLQGTSTADLPACQPARR